MTKTRETMIAELGRRHPAAADDVDAILAMPRSDAVNEGLLADECWHDLIEKDDRNSPEDYPDHALITKDELAAYIVRALRAVHSPDTAGVLPEYAKIRHRGIFIERQLQGGGKYLFICHTGISKFLPDLYQTQAEAIAAVDAALSPSHCTAGRREEIVEAALKKADLGSWGTFTDGTPTPNVIAFADAIFALTSEQSGPTAGREDKSLQAMIAEIYGNLDAEDCAWVDREWAKWRKLTLYTSEVLTPSPPDRQQDQGETSVLPREVERVLREARRFADPDGDPTALSARVLISQIDAALADASPPVSDASREALEHIRELFEKAPHLREADGSLPGAHPVTWKDLASLDVEQ